MNCPPTSTSPSVSPTSSLVCSVKSCVHRNTSLFKCRSTDCPKRMHAECFVKKFSKKECFSMVGPNTIFCSKKCYDKAKREARAQPGWLFDGAMTLTTQSVSFWIGYLFLATMHRGEVVRGITAKGRRTLLY